MKGMIFIDVEKCVSCKRCQFFCALAHTEAKNIIEALDDPTAESRIQIEEYAGFAVPLQCHHCEGAPCVIACPTGAIKRISMDVPVVVDNDLCVGCQTCTIVCPFGVPRLDRYQGKKMIKCDMCIDRLNQGEEPACVAACHTGALTFRYFDEISLDIKKRKYERLRLID